MLKKSPSKNTVPSSSKSKKSNKDKDRRKEHENEKQNIINNMPVDNLPEETMSEQYSVFGAETIMCIGDQCIEEEITEDVCTMLSEDISFKIRELISAMRTNMHQGKRKYAKIEDVNHAFKRFNIERIYGPDEPNWITFDDPDDLSCIPDESVNLLEFAQEEAKFVEPGDIGLDYKWINDESNFEQSINDTLKNYCQKVMKYSISNKESLRTLVLKDVQKNINIGPILPQLCNFCFLILQKNITYDFLAIPILELLEAILFNPCLKFSIQEKQLTLLILLLLQYVMNATNNTIDRIYSMCRIMARLSELLPGGVQMIVEKIKKHSPPNIIQSLTAPVMCVLTFLGNYALDALVWSHIDEICMFLSRVVFEGTMEFRSTFLTAVIVLCRQRDLNYNILNKIREEFGDSLMPVFSTICDEDFKSVSEIVREDNWLQIKRALLRTQKARVQQSVVNRTSHHKIMFNKAAPFVRKKNVVISGFTSLPVKRKDVHIVIPENIKSRKYVSIVTGRRTLFTLQKKNSRKCCKSDYLLYGI